MIFGQKKQNEAVKTRIREYCELIRKTVAEFKRMIEEYIDWDKHFKELSRKVHSMEHEADVIRREIERAMYEGAFLPAYRGDYINLLETLDRVANKAEEAGDTLYLMRPDIPEEIRADLVRIAELTVQAFERVPDAVMRVLGGDTEIQEVDSFVEEMEQEIDKIQFNITRMLFKKLDIEKVDALMVKLLIDQICSVSDRIENVMDKLSIIAIKRRLA